MLVKSTLVNRERTVSTDFIKGATITSFVLGLSSNSVSYNIMAFHTTKFNVFFFTILNIFIIAKNQEVRHVFIKLL